MGDAVAPQIRLVGEGLFEESGSLAGGAVLLGSKCGACGEVVFPELLDCPACLGFGTMAPARLVGRGHLRDFVVAERGPAGFAVPYIQAYVKLVDGPVVFSTIAGAPQDGSTLKIGEEMIMTVERIRSADGVDIVGWKFRPVRS